MHNVNLPYATLHYEEPIIYIFFRDKAQLGFLEIRELNYLSKKLSNGNPYFTLSHVPLSLRLTPMGKKIAEDINESPLCKGAAIVVKKEMVMYAANFFHSIKRKKFHFKAFTEEKDARGWLLNLDEHTGQRPVRRAV